jgi:hypothetical protein
MMARRRELGQRRERPLRRAGLWLAVCGAALGVAACGETADPSAQYFPTTRPTAPPGAPLLAVGDNAAGGSAIAPASGVVARPNPSLTPGAIATTSTTQVCAMPHTGQAIPAYVGKVVASEYGLVFNPVKYDMDYLVPLELGGANVYANIWPVSTSGVGFHQKEQLNARLRVLVCQGALSLNYVQTTLESDWYALYLRYGG